MQKFLLALVMLFLSACASSGGGSAPAASNDGGLPEIAAYDEEAVEDLPEMVASES